MLKLIEGRFLAFAVAVIAFSIAFITSLSLSGLPGALICSVSFILVLLVVYPIWLSPSYGTTKIRLACIALISGLCFYYLVPADVLLSVANGVLIPSVRKLTDSQIGEIKQIDRPLYVLLIMLAGVTVVLLTLPDRSPISGTLVQKRPRWQTPRQREELMAFARLWEHRLDIMDREANWSHYDFIPLEAEVEIQSPNRTSRGVSNFLAALRTDDTQEPILVLGEPGSGKSVALRNLCRLLLQETPKISRLPLYVNLKNWKPEGTWSESCPPTTKDLQLYVKNYVVSESDDVFADRFLKSNFEIMLKRGIVFFILDSFDEIPAVMDAQEGSWIIAALSNVVGNFLYGAHASRGIVASRYFKRPTEHLRASSIYRVKPFDDARIRRLLRQVGGRSAQDIRAIFATKPDLVSMAKNPMVASLLATFVYEHGGTLPDSKLALFHDYVERRLSDAGVQERLAQSGIDRTQLVTAAVVLATKMINNPAYGLEASLSALQDEAPGLPLIEGAKILRFARLARGGSDARQNFSFVHRRFQEYFAVVGLMLSERSLELESIGRDARYRDTLALYAEIAHEGVANEIVSYCGKR